MMIAKYRSDYGPDTILTIVRTDDGDIVLRIRGNEEFRIATSGGKLHGEDLNIVVEAFERIIQVMNKKSGE